MEVGDGKEGRYGVRPSTQRRPGSSPTGDPPILRWRRTDTWETSDQRFRMPIWVRTLPSGPEKHVMSSSDSIDPESPIPCPKVRKLGVPRKGSRKVANEQRKKSSTTITVNKNKGFVYILTCDPSPTRSSLTHRRN